MVNASMEYLKRLRYLSHCSQVGRESRAMKKPPNSFREHRIEGRERERGKGRGEEERGEGEPRECLVQY